MKALDQELMSEEWGFKLEQLMELAGLSCACAINHSYPAKNFPRILFVIGPGNNGGDGLVAARHVRHFGYDPVVFHPTKSKKFDYLLTQCRKLEIKVIDKLPSADELAQQYDLICDAIFGFSFSGDIRPPFNEIITELNKCSRPIISIDIPSGWDVDHGNVNGNGLEPKSLISLSAPKLCSKNFKGIHWLGGRFVPEALQKKYQLDLPKYEGCEQVILISG
ncbi:NAD(P)H-hydrate epimerase-like isoform X2 [Schistocerca gregaria]|nr:NAD(P)H-hydrate epimerase-like isoform X2 [Schistocerca gregaria]